MPPGTPALSACTAQGMWRPARMKVKTHQDERTSSLQLGLRDCHEEEDIG